MESICELCTVSNLYGISDYSVYLVNKFESLHKVLDIH
jgi:L-rhamnose mutarotase